MKTFTKFLVLTACLFFSMNLLAETIYWEETFDVNNGDWSLDANWSISSGKLELYWSPTISPYDLSAISSSISLPMNVDDLIVTQHVNVFSYVNEVAEILLLTNMGEYQLWYYPMSSNWGSDSGSDISFPLNDYAGQDIQIRFRSYGQSTYNINWWDIFNVSITVLYDNDLRAMDVDGPHLVNPGEEGAWTVNIENAGLNTQDNYTVGFYKHGGEELGTVAVSDPLAPGATASYDFYWSPQDQENTGVYGVVYLAGDEYGNNDQSAYCYVRISEDLNLNVLIWDNDNSSDYEDPETGLLKNCEDGIENALSMNGIDYAVTTVLPSDLSTFDMVFISLGLYCVG